MLGLRCSVVCAALLAGCVDAKTTVCSNGVVCPSGLVCHDESSSCADPDAIAACSGLDAGGACTISGVAGECTDGLCVGLQCGDGVLTDPEQCEPGLLAEALTCGELGFHRGDTVGCTEVCTYDISACSETCGDQILNGPEECEQGFPGADRNCTSLAGGDVFDVGLQRCSSLCSLREDHCKIAGWDALPFPLFNGGGPIHGSWVSSDGALFSVGANSGFVGESASLQRFSNGEWNELGAAPMTGFSDPRNRWGFWGTSSSDLWFGFAGAVAHWDGVSLSSQSLTESSDVLAISGVDASALFALTAAGVLFRYDGASWSRAVTVPGVNHDIYALESNRVLIVGDEGIRTWDGSVLTLENPTGGAFTDIHGFASDDVWAIEIDDAGERSRLFHFDGAAWSPTTIVSPGDILEDIAGDDSHAFAVGTNGATYYYNGAHWTRSSVPRFNDDEVGADLLHAACANDTFLALEERVGALNPVLDVWRWRGFAVSPSVPLSVDLEPTDVWVSDPSHWVVVGKEGIDEVAHHFDGELVTKRTIRSGLGTDPQIQSVWGSALDNLFAVGGPGNVVYHFQGESWSVETANAEADNFERIHGSSANNIWAVGNGDTISRFDGSTWSAVPPPPSGAVARIFSAVYTISEDFALVGSNGMGQQQDGDVFIWDGTTWTAANLSPNGDVVDIRGSGPDDIWVLTQERNGVEAFNTRFFHYDHTEALETARWREYPRPDSALEFHRLVVLSPNEAFAAGVDDLSAHFDGEGWALIRLGTKGLRALDGVDGAVIGVGTDGSGDQVAASFTWSRRWSCTGVESDCTNHVDDDCDGRIDGRDSDCQ